jgi:hypothetical protein
MSDRMSALRPGCGSATLFLPQFPEVSKLILAFGVKQSVRDVVIRVGN